MKAPPIILASKSPRRIEYMTLLGIKHKVVPSQYKENLESMPKDMLPQNIAMHFAKEKAAEVASREQGIIIGSDTIVVLNNRILGKPKDKKHAELMLKRLRGTIHHVITAIAIIDTTTGKEKTDYEKTAIKMRKISDYELDTYVKTGEPLDKAGAYGIQGKAGAFVEKIDGCYTNVVGFPLPLLIRMLAGFGVKL